MTLLYSTILIGTKCQISLAADYTHNSIVITMHIQACGYRPHSACTLTTLHTFHRVVCPKPHAHLAQGVTWDAHIHTWGQVSYGSREDRGVGPYCAARGQTGLLCMGVEGYRYILHSDECNASD